MNFTIAWILDKLGFIPRFEVKVEKPKRVAKKVAKTVTKTATKPRKRRLG